MSNQTFIGVIKSYNGGNGYGFIECPETHAIYGRDIFLHRAEYCNCGVDVGSHVQFEILVSDKNQPKAVNVQAHGDNNPVQNNMAAAIQMNKPGPVNNMSNGGIGTNTMTPAGGGMNGGLALGSTIQAPTKRGRNEMNEQRLFGQIRTFNQEKGFGFIQSETAAHMYGSPDVFLHYSQALNFRVGDFVTFELFVGEQGKPQARDLIKEGGAPIGIPPPVNQQPNRFNNNQINNTNNRGNSNSAHISPADLNRQYSGIIKSYNEQRGFGFIECQLVKEKFGRDVFLIRKEVELHTLDVGEQITFTLKLDKGNPQACVLGRTSEFPVDETIINASLPMTNVTSMPMSSESPQDKLAAVGVGPHLGIIKSYNEAKGFGFIACEHIEAVFGHDVFLHKSEMRDVNGVGKECEFNIMLNKMGKPQAQNLTILDTATGCDDEIGGKFDTEVNCGTDFENVAKKRKLAV